MKDLESRVTRELRAEWDLVPHASPGPLPQQTRRWSRYLPAVAALLVMVLGSWWLLARPSDPPVPVASTVTVVAVTGDADSEVVELWAAWWRAYAEVRETATVQPDGSGGTFTREPLQGLAVDSEAVMAVAGLLFTAEADGSPVEMGGPSEIRLTPNIQLENGRASVRDCVYLDPIPWPGLREPNSTAGTVVLTAELRLTGDGWRVSQFGPEPLVEQLTGEPCQPGEG